MLANLDINPYVLWFIATMIVFVLMFIFVKPKKKKSKATKKENKEKADSPKTEKTEDVAKSEKTEEVATNEVQEESKADATKKKVKKAKTKPEITQVYQRTEKKHFEEEKKVDDGPSEELLARAQFVNKNKKISKFAGFMSEEELAAMTAEQNQEESLSEELSDGCEECERIVTHFDHSRRLSKIIQEDAFDRMFMEHLTTHNIDVDVQKHLRNIDERIFERASKMLSNSETKVLVEDENSDKPVEQIKNDKEFMKSWLEARRAQEQANFTSSGETYIAEDAIKEHLMINDLELNAKNLVVAEAVIKRKSLRHKK